MQSSVLSISISVKTFFLDNELHHNSLAYEYFNSNVKF